MQAQKVQAAYPATGVPVGQWNTGIPWNIYTTGSSPYLTGNTDIAFPLNQPGAASPEDVKQLAAEVEAAAKKLQEKPDDPQVLAELNCAVERLKKAKEPKRDP